MSCAARFSLRHHDQTRGAYSVTSRSQAAGSLVCKRASRLRDVAAPARSSELLSCGCMVSVRPDGTTETQRSQRIKEHRRESESATIVQVLHFSVFSMALRFKQIR